MSTSTTTEVCSVGGDASTPPTITCPACHLRCHTRCSGKRMGALCDNCRERRPTSGLRAHQQQPPLPRRRLPQSQPSRVINQHARGPLCLPSLVR
ncbi:hypothetical protein TSAR_005456 [Trichomalopsis sarcophagae]|uniref:Phorbol-ester/DAG-type domain-containing protein n=1 Tax=Trichomalopsis sarcophagae TaxID=543379 RepID=A0A232ER38_9HYME|nr:hypothetical protein TSAR_005456 [Trichomalopsis sarcophagae]